MFFLKNFRAILCKCPLFHLSFIFLFLELVTSNSFPLLASSQTRSPIKQQTSSISAITPTNPGRSTIAFPVAQVSGSNSPLSDGIHLYGQSSVPEQVGQEYMVFEVRQDRMLGAVYMPRSEFYCFYGSVNTEHVNLSIVDHYDNNQIHSYAIALTEPSSTLAASYGMSNSTQLTGYEKIHTISSNDRRILSTCLEEHQERWEVER